MFEIFLLHIGKSGTERSAPAAKVAEMFRSGSIGQHAMAPAHCLLNNSVESKLPQYSHSLNS